MIFPKDLIRIVLDFTRRDRCRVFDFEYNLTLWTIENGFTMQEFISRVNTLDLPSSSQEKFLSQWNIMKNEVNVGDVIDVERYRGCGLFFFDGDRFHHSVGEYGYFLPAEAFPFLDNCTNMSFFTGIGSEWVLIPPNVEWRLAKDNPANMSRILKLIDITSSSSAHNKIGISDGSVCDDDMVVEILIQGQVVRCHLAEFY